MDATNTDKAKYLGPLKLIRKIAAGGMAEVWEARKEGLEGFSKRLAVKVILPHLSEDDTFIHMFLDEGRLVARLDHPNICRMYDLGEVSGTYYMSMEYIDGVVVSAILKEAAKRGIYIPIEHCCQIAIGACAGLDYAHSATYDDGLPLNLIHRDVSPQNIMLTFAGNVKVVDFGIAKAATQLQHTNAGVIKGKYAYMSPEQATGLSLDCRSDVFAMGVVLWELTTGRRLFRAENDIATLHKIIGGDYDMPSMYRDDYPPELEMIVMKALSVERDERFQDCGEMQLALEDFLLRNSLAAGSKRLGYYVRWLLSDEEMPDLSSSLISSGSIPLEPSDPLIHTPSRNEEIKKLTASKSNPSARMHQAPTEALPAFQEGEGSLGAIESSLDTPKAPRKSKWLWMMLLLILLGGGGVFAYIQTQSVTALRPWSIRSEPTAASVFINGERVGKTGDIIYVKLGSSVALRIVKKGYRPYYKFFRILNEEHVEKALKVQLKRESDNSVAQYGFVSVNVKPSNATAFLNGKKLVGVSTTGLISFSGRVRAGEQHTLIVKHPKLQDVRRTFIVQANVQKIMMVELKKNRRSRTHRRRNRRSHRRVASVRKSNVRSGKIRITSTPSGAIVFFNGKMTTSTPMGGFVELAAHKTHRIVVQKKGYSSFSQSITLAPGQQKKIHARLKSHSRPSSYVYLASDPVSYVYINGKRIGRTPILRRRIPVGRYKVEFRTVKYQVSYSRRLKFEAGTQRFFHRFPKGRLWVLSRSIGSIYLGKNFLGKTRQPPYTVPAGTYRLRVVFGGKSEYRTIKVWAGRKKTIRIMR